MKNFINKVREFHRQIGAPVATTPQLLKCRPEECPKLSQEIREVMAHCQAMAREPNDLPARLSLALEEMAEWVEAHATGDLVAAADAWGDRLYVLLGDAVATGLPGEEILDEIHRSNMTKTDPEFNSTKSSKGADYSRPDLERLLQERESTAIVVDVETRRKNDNTPNSR